MGGLVKWIVGTLVVASVGAAFGAVLTPDSAYNRWVCQNVWQQLNCSDEVLEIADAEAIFLASDFFALTAGLIPPPTDTRSYKGTVGDLEVRRKRGEDAYALLSDQLQRRYDPDEFVLIREQLRWSEVTDLRREAGPRNTFRVVVRNYIQTADFDRSIGMPGVIETSSWRIGLQRDRTQRSGFVVTELRHAPGTTSRVRVFPMVLSPRPTATYYLPSPASAIQAGAERWAQRGARWFVLCQVERTGASERIWWSRSEHGWIWNGDLADGRDERLDTVDESCAEHHGQRQPEAASLR